MKRKAKTPFRVVGGWGEWFAFSHHYSLPIHAPHARRIYVRSRRGLVQEIAIGGRSPTEALERLKRYLGVAK